MVSFNTVNISLIVVFSVLGPGVAQKIFESNHKCW